MAEFQLIESIRAQFPSAEDVLLGIGDDAAVLQVPPGELLVVSTDTLVAGTHFFADAEPRALGHKCLAVNLSDLAAMGATPRWFTLNLTLPGLDLPYLKAFFSGMRALAKEFAITLVGGDTTSGPFAVSVTVLGTVAHQHELLKRSGARLGDGIYVSGTLGDAAAALVLRYAELPEPRHLSRRLDQPLPRVALGKALGSLASACLDVSDGLLADLGHLCRNSGWGAVLQIEQLPLSKALRRSCGLLQSRRHALNGGDDYELCFTAPPAREAELALLSQQLAVPITRIGTITQSKSIVLRNAQGKRLKLPKHSGYEHFSA